MDVDWELAMDKIESWINTHCTPRTLGRLLHASAIVWVFVFGAWIGNDLPREKSRGQSVAPQSMEEDVASQITHDAFFSRVQEIKDRRKKDEAKEI